MLAHCGGFQKRAPSPRTTTVNEKKQDITLHVQSALCQRRKNLQGKKGREGNVTIVTGWRNHRKLFLLYTFQIFYDKMHSFKISS